MVMVTITLICTEYLFVLNTFFFGHEVAYYIEQNITA